MLQCELEEHQEPLITLYDNYTYDVISYDVYIICTSHSPFVNDPLLLHMYCASISALGHVYKPKLASITSDKSGYDIRSAIIDKYK